MGSWNIIVLVLGPSQCIFAKGCSIQDYLEM